MSPTRSFQIELKPRQKHHTFYISKENQSRIQRVGNFHWIIIIISVLSNIFVVVLCTAHIPMPNGLLLSKNCVILHIFPHFASARTRTQIPLPCIRHQRQKEEQRKRERDGKKMKPSRFGFAGIFLIPSMCKESDRISVIKIQNANRKISRWNCIWPANGMFGITWKLSVWARVCVCERENELMRERTRLGAKEWEWHVCKTAQHRITFFVSSFHTACTSAWLAFNCSPTMWIHKTMPFVNNKEKFPSRDDIP